jgi:guanine deaminase
VIREDEQTQTDMSAEATDTRSVTVPHGAAATLSGPSDGGSSPPYACHMKLAIQLSQIGALVQKCGGPFGAVVVKDGRIVGEGYNTVLSDNDPSAHAEVNAIRNACQQLKTVHLKDCDLYTSAECCSMCLSLAYWSHVRHIYRAASAADTQRYGGFDDVRIQEQLQRPASERTIPETVFMRDEALAVWEQYQAMPGKQSY